MSALLESPMDDRTTNSTAAVDPIRCLIVDDHAAVRLGLKDLLGRDQRFEVLDAVANAEAAAGFAERVEMDVAIIDYQLGGRTGLWASRKLKRLPRPPAVLVYSAYSDGALAAACVVAGADGLLDKSRVDLELCAAICELAAGHSRLPALSPSFAASMRQLLDFEEQAIFGMLLARIPPEQIAVTLGIAREGLESRRSAMLQKLELQDMAG